MNKFLESTFNGKISNENNIIKMNLNDTLIQVK